ncbi:hypothetical protein C8N40_11642 [Pontibacter mucosus]|uniref:Uncharacterized protein n=1 Tax=Pontibacter mucosus TaxID=1649266 RepID=A0A2T5Y3G6_9BACT|nr:hypothetical protein C8N40_11642 [Pontibacter mucosus]
MYLLRKASKYKKNSFKWLLFNFLKSRYSHKYGFQIPSSTQIGEGFYIGHYGPIVINGKAKTVISRTMLRLGRRTGAG